MVSATQLSNGLSAVLPLKSIGKLSENCFEIGILSLVDVNLDCIHPRILNYTGSKLQDSPIDFTCSNAVSLKKLVIYLSGNIRYLRASECFPPEYVDAKDFINFRWPYNDRDRGVTLSGKMIHRTHE